MPHNTTYVSTQSGIALIMVLLVVALATIITVGMVSRQYVDIRRTTNMIDHEQAYMYLLGAEDWAKLILKEDLDDNDTDDLEDAWAKSLPPIPVEGGNISGTLSDLHARFNINSILVGDKVNNDSYFIFKRILRQKIEDYNEDTAAAVVDWIDSNQNAFGDSGAEDTFYLNKKVPYRTANQLITSASELALINGFDYNKYESVKDYLFALPVETKININTASPEVLISLADNLSEEDGKKIVAERGKEGFKKIEDMLKLEQFKGKKVNTDLLTVSSEYFLLTAKANIGVASATLYSIIHRSSEGKFKVILRTTRDL